MGQSEADTPVSTACAARRETLSMHIMRRYVRVTVVPRGSNRSRSKRQTPCLATELWQNLNALSHNANCHQNSCTEHSLS